MADKVIAYNEIKPTNACRCDGKARAVRNIK